MEPARTYPGFWQAVLLLVAEFMVAALVTAVGATTFFVLEFPFLRLLTYIAAHLSCLLILWYGLWKTGAPPAEVFPLRRVPLRVLAATCTCTAGASICLGGFSDLMPAADLPSWFVPLTTLLVAPITEELLFRGLILRGFLGRYEPGLPIPLSAALFGASHIPGNGAVIPGFVLGMLNGWWRVETKSLWPCLLGHFVSNALPYLDPVRKRAFPWFCQSPWFGLEGLLLVAIGFYLLVSSEPDSEGAGPADATGHNRSSGIG